MTSYVLKLGGAAIGLLIVGIGAFILFGNIWARVGIGAAIAVVFGGLLLLAWYHDRKEREKRAGIEDLPRI
jgi:membrane associated rhomboid family serine protease